MGCCISSQKQAQILRRLAELSASITRLTNSTTNYQTQNNTLQSQIGVLNNRVRQSEQNSGQQITQRNHRIQELRRMQGQLNASLSTKNNKFSLLNIQLVNLQAAIASLQSMKPINGKANNYYTQQNVQRKKLLEEKQNQLFSLNLQCYESTGSKATQSLERSIQDKNAQYLILKSRRDKLRMELFHMQDNMYLIILSIENKVPIQIPIQGKKTIKQFKQIVYKDYYDQLPPGLMLILQNGDQINSDQKIMFTFPPQQKQIKLTLRKAEVWELEGFTTDKDKPDELYGQMGVVYMKCGHFYSRTAMRQVIKYQTNTINNYYFVCPNNKLGQQNLLCEQIYMTEDCQIVGGYTQDEWRPISEQLTLNYIKKKTKICPNQNCKNSIIPLGVNTKRIKCSACRAVDFCIQCGEVWRWEGNSNCFSQTCNQMMRLIANAPRDRIFQVYTYPQTENRFAVAVPNTRLCPRCKCLIKNTNYCKHTVCLFCTTSFCFICMRVESENWPCGGAYQYCGKVEPNPT